MNNKRSKNKNIFMLKDILEKALSQYRISYDTLILKVWDIWQEALGDFVSENTKPSAFKGGLLIVNVNNPSMMQELHFMKKNIIANLNRTIGEDIVKDIKFKAGADDL